MFRNPGTTEFVIVTIPTAMAAAESIRLAKALQKEQVGCSGREAEGVSTESRSCKELAARQRGRAACQRRLACNQPAALLPSCRTCQPALLKLSLRLLARRCPSERWWSIRCCSRACKTSICRWGCGRGRVVVVCGLSCKLLPVVHSRRAQALHSMVAASLPATRFPAASNRLSCTTPAALQTRRADQQRALERLRADPELGQLQLIEAPLFDLEVRNDCWDV